MARPESAAFAGFDVRIWIGMWFDRSPWLGPAQLPIFVAAFRYEIEPREMKGRL